ncbi:globin domain-containing protein [Streptomyces sp. R21]|uniref:nitric oxide dioxygenase n=1 Tax=Streptomyces sp. R21 TaxID=3238627 RepID=A0AB39PGA1_9ACTN
MDPEILRSSFAVVERRAEFAVKYFYSHLFRHNPDVRGLFPLDFPEDMERQRDRLFAALTHVVERLEDPALPHYLRDLGRDHRKYLAEPDHYAAVGASLIAAFATVSGSAWNAEVEKTWSEAYGAITNVMLQGAWEAQHEGEPPWWDAEVVARTRYGDDLVLLTLRPHRPLPHTPGQYVSVNCPHLPGIWRPYSLANAPRADHTVDLHISLVEDGVLSTALVRQTRKGDTLRLGAPGGSLVLRAPEGRPLTFIAAGTGWAPVKALLEQLAEGYEEREEHEAYEEYGERDGVGTGAAGGADEAGGIGGAGTAGGSGGAASAGTADGGGGAVRAGGAAGSPGGPAAPGARGAARRPTGLRNTGSRDSAPEARLFLVARDTSSLYDRSAVERLQARLPWLAVTFITPAPGRPKAQATERLLTALGNRANWARHDVYLAGPPKLVEEIGEALPTLGTAPERIFHDILPPTGQSRTRPLGTAEWLLDRPQPNWHNPSGRAPNA